MSLKIDESEISWNCIIKSLVTNTCYTTYVIMYAKQKHPGCKKRRGQLEAAVIK